MSSNSERKSSLSVLVSCFETSYLNRLLLSVCYQLDVQLVHITTGQGTVKRKNPESVHKNKLETHPSRHYEKHTHDMALSFRVLTFQGSCTRQHSCQPTLHARCLRGNEILERKTNRKEFTS